MKYYSLIVFFALTTSMTNAQNGTVTIEQDYKIEQLLSIYKANLNNQGYYTIQIGFVNTNEKANHLKSLATIDFPKLTSKIYFDSPTYRVRLGRFKSKLAAERKFIEVRKKYPNAMLLKPKKSTK